MGESVLSIIIPVYNEAESLPAVLPPLLKYASERQWKIIITNDGSTDKTGEILSGFASSNPFLKVITHKLNKGYGAAIKSGVTVADTEFVITIDADGQHYIEDIETLLKFALEKDADMVVGSRKKMKSATLVRGIGKAVIRWVAKILMPLPIYDLNSGMKLYKTELAKKYLYLCPDSMAYSDVIALLFINNRHLVCEYDIKIKERIAGKSTIGYKTAFETIMEIISIVMLFHPLRIFLPVSGVILTAGFIWGIRCYIRTFTLSTLSSLLFISGILIFLLGLIAEQLAEIRRNIHIKE